MTGLPDKKTPDPRARGRARGALAAFAQRIGRTYDDILDSANHFLDTGERLCGGSEIDSIDIPNEYWAWYEAATGDDPSQSPHYNENGTMFRCAC